MLFITHDLGVVACIADGVLVLNQGRLCEPGPIDHVLSSPADELHAPPARRRALAARDGRRRRRGINGLPEAVGKG